MSTIGNCMKTKTTFQTLQEDTKFPFNGYTDFKFSKRRNLWQEKLEVAAVVRSLRLPSKRRILEIGCGQGFAMVPIYFLCQPTRFVGVDINQRFINRAKRRLKVREVEAELYCEDVRKLPFPDMCFDIVFDFGTCYHISHNHWALKEIARVLTVSGLFIYETGLNQFLSHPIRSFGKRIPWNSAPELKPHRARLLWSSRIKQANGFLS